MRLLAGALVFNLGLISSAPVMAAENLYRPLSKVEFEAFDSEYWKLSACQKAVLARDVTPDELAARLIGKHLDSELIDLALRLLPGDDRARALLMQPGISQVMRVEMAMGGLGLYAGGDRLLPSQAMRAFGVVRKYTAIAIAPACQPTPKFLSTLKVMLDEDF